MIVLAHRGWWRTPDERNSKTAILRAFEAGFGVETDVRDCDGELVLAHDPPLKGACPPFEWVIESFAKAGQPGQLAINVKADGLQARLAASLERHAVTRAFVFDMAVPDARGYLSSGISTFTRHSEMEPEPPFYDRAAGVWMDCFEGDWIGEGEIRRHLLAGKQVAVVSPELHGRAPEAAWARWSSFAGSRVAICTDLPGALPWRAE